MNAGESDEQLDFTCPFFDDFNACDSTDNAPHIRINTYIHSLLFGVSLVSIVRYSGHTDEPKLLQDFWDTLYVPLKPDISLFGIPRAGRI